MTILHLLYLSLDGLEVSVWWVSVSDTWRRHFGTSWWTHRRILAAVLFNICLMAVTHFSKRQFTKPMEFVSGTDKMAALLTLTAWKPQQLFSEPRYTRFSMLNQHICTISYLFLTSSSICSWMDLQGKDYNHPSHSYSLLSPFLLMVLLHSKRNHSSILESRSLTLESLTWPYSIGSTWPLHLWETQLRRLSKGETKNICKNFGLSIWLCIEPPVCAWVTDSSSALDHTTESVTYKITPRVPGFCVEGSLRHLILAYFILYSTGSTM